MLLAIDAGNTRVKLALFHGSSIAARGAVPSGDLASVGDTITVYERLIAASGAASAGLRVAIASVSPRLTPLLAEAGSALSAAAPLVVSHRVNLGLAIAVREPARLGADRIAAAVAAANRHGVPAIVADFGTALTFTVVTAERRIIGGAIAPGLRTGARALAAFTGQLPDIGPLDEVPEPPAIGADTECAIRSGTLYGTAGAAREIVDRICADLGTAAVVVATGGSASLLARYCGINIVDPDLTLYGIEIIATLNPVSAN